MQVQMETAEPELSFTAFAKPDFTLPLLIEEYAAALPTQAYCRGMFMNALLDSTEREAGRRPKGHEFVHFKEYPIRDFMYLAQECAHMSFPRTPLRECLRRFGQNVFPMLSQTMIGRTIFGVAMRDWPRTLDLASRGYPVSIRPGTARLLEMHEDRAVIALREVWSFPDCYQVGIFEGAMQTFGLRGEVRVRSHSKCDADLLIIWR